MAGYRWILQGADAAIVISLLAAMPLDLFQFFSGYVIYETVKEDGSAENFCIVYFLRYQSMTSPQKGISHPWLFGTYAVYAPDMDIARQVYEYVTLQNDVSPFGTVELVSGEQIDWVNIRSVSRPAFAN
jgi:hypothetical protein